MTIADAVVACKRVQDAKNIPIFCNVERVEGIAAMFIGFRNDYEAGQYFSAMVDEVAGPFCRSANNSNRQAAIYVTVQKKWAKRFDCEMQHWVDVQLPNTSSTPEPAQPAPTGRPGTPERSLTFDEAIAVCQRIQREATIPIGCEMNYVEGLPAIFMSFRSEADSKEYLEPMAKYVAVPFCSAAIEQHTAAAVFMILQGETPKRAKEFRCDSQRWTDWAALPNTPRRPPTVQPAARRTRTREQTF